MSVSTPERSTPLILANTLSSLETPLPWKSAIFFPFRSCGLLMPLFFR